MQEPVKQHPMLVQAAQNNQQQRDGQQTPTKENQQGDPPTDQNLMTEEDMNKFFGQC